MTQALFRVNAPIVHPIVADDGQYLAWYQGRDVVVMCRDAPAWTVVRRLDADSAEAVCALHLQGVLTLVYVCGALSSPTSSRPKLRLLS